MIGGAPRVRMAPPRRIPPAAMLVPAGRFAHNRRMPEEPSPAFETRCVHAGEDVEVRTRPLAPAIHQASVFETPTLDVVEQALTDAPGYFIYSRDANPTVAALEHAVAELEGGEGCVAAASGMGAISMLFLALLRPGDHVVAARELYGTTVTLLSGALAALGIQASFVDATDALAVRAALTGATRMVFVESISNPLMRLADIPALAEVARAADALLVVDASFTSPALGRPLQQGADVSLHSATKYLSGHSDVTAGVVTASAEVVDRVREAARTFGPTCAPLDAWLTLRGLKTLALRMERHSQNGAALAGWLANQPAVRRVHFAGLPADPQRPLAARLYPRGLGGMLSFELEGGRRAVERFLGGLKLVRFAASLADVSTTVSYPATTSHRGLTPEQRRALGIGEGLVRLSAGIEAIADITADLEQGLAAAGA